MALTWHYISKEHGPRVYVAGIKNVAFVEVEGAGDTFEYRLYSSPLGELIHTSRAPSLSLAKRRALALVNTYKK